MRLPKHKLPKRVQKHEPSAKHKKSAASLAKRAAKEEKKNQMTVDSEPTSQLTDQQKFIAKMQRKQINKPNVMYKKINASLTHFNGPRAVSK